MSSKVVIKRCYDVEKLLDNWDDYISDELFYNEKILRINNKLYGVIVYTGGSDQVSNYTKLITNKHGGCKVLDYKWDFDNISTVLYLVGEYKAGKLTDVWKAIALGDYTREEHIANGNSELFQKFYNGKRYLINGDWYAIFSNGGSGNIIYPMTECSLVLSELLNMSLYNKKSINIIDCYIEDDKYDWLFIFR